MKKESDSIKIVDNSGDRNHFTIIPNFIINHSTAIAQSLYVHLKRLAGENQEGTAYPSQKYLAERLGVTRPTIRKELKYLIEHGWIEEIDPKDIMTDNGLRKVRQFKIVDLWKLNAEHYASKK